MGNGEIVKYSKSSRQKKQIVKSKISFAMNINGWSGCVDVGLAVDDTWHGTTTPPNRSSGDGLE